MTLLKRFLKADQGTIAVTFALSLVPILVAAGVGIDMARFSVAQTQAQQALDAGAMAAAAAKGITSAQRKKIGEDVFAANVKEGLVAPLNLKPIYTISAQTVVGRVDGTMETTLMAAAGMTDMAIGTSTEVSIPGSKKAEIALVLDYSGSMGDKAGKEVKYVAMRNAAIKLIDDVTKENPANVKLALVPFSHHVYTTLPNTMVLGQVGAGTWTGCTQDRQYPYNLTDASPLAMVDATKWSQPTAPDHAAYGCSGYASHGLKLKPLTNDFAALKSQLNSMTPYAYTHVPLGVEFGYHVLSPNAPYSEGVNYNDKSTNKFMVVLTDGEQTEPAFGPGGIRTVDQGNKNLEALCNNVKASGITIITIAYDLTDSSQSNRLKTCATNPAENFFVANNTTDVALAFQSITNSITATAFMSK
jgi:Flp pilus assembly protein TadG